MIENFASLVNRYGFIPNGGRVYYLARSQPPLFTSMAYAYFQQTKNVTWLRQNIDTLETELHYWLTNQSLQECGHTLFHYNSPSYGPRPESYREDYLTAAFLTNESSKNQLYIDLKSGAESGWDFSARWIFDSQVSFGTNVYVWLPWVMENVRRGKIRPFSCLVGMGLLLMDIK